MTAPSETIGRYRLGPVLGGSGGTVVYRAEDPRLGRVVALKVLAADRTADDASRALLVDEARLVARVVHPHVIPLLEAGEADGTVFLAFQLAPDADLRHLLDRERRLDPARVVALLGPLADAFDHLHAMGIVHADVKPENIVLSARGEPGERVALVDFGISVTAADPIARAASPAYAPPEQLRGEPIDGRADVHAFAAVVWECLAGAPPSAASSDAFGFWPPDPHGALPRFDEVRPDLHPDLSDALVAGLAPDAAERTPTAGALFAAIAAALGQGPRPTLPVADADADAAGRVRHRSSAGLHRRGLFVGAGAVAFAAIAATSAFAFPGRGGVPHPSSRPVAPPVGVAERALQASIPAPIRATCHRATDPRPAVAVVTCTDGPVRVQYERYATVAGMRTAFGRASVTIRSESADLCAQGVADEWTWRADPAASAASGNYRCTVQPDGARLDWTTDALKTVGHAIRVDGDLRELHTWWASAGPVDTSAAPR